jgi:HEAT repeat protein
MSSASLAVYFVLYGFALILFGCAMVITSMKFIRHLRERHDGPIRVAMKDLPTRVVLDEQPPRAPGSGRRRTVALELVLDSTASLTGTAKERAALWFEENGYVDEFVRVLRIPRRSWRRAHAATHLGRMGSRRAAPALAHGLRDPRYRVRDACATALGRVATTREVPELIASAERQDVPRGILSGALLSLDADANPALIACLRHPEPKIRELVARVLGMRRATEAAQALVLAVDDPYPAVRRHAILALADIAAHDVIDVPAEPLVRLAVDDEAIVRSAAATALGQILGDRAHTVLGSMTRDADYWVSHRAAESLCRLPTGERFGWEILANHDDGPGARRARAACLEWMERTGALERRLDRIAAGGDDDKLIAALEVLDAIGSRAWGDILPRSAAPAVDADVERVEVAA